MEIVTTIAPVCLAIIMFGLGLGLTIGDFTRVLKNPRDFLVGFICQVILLPIIAFILINPKLLQYLFLVLKKVCFDSAYNIYLYSFINSAMML